MNKPIDVFCEIPCLTEKTSKLSGSVLLKKWFPKADRRYLGQFLQKFIEYNLQVFSFLGVTPLIIGSDQNSGISFRTSEFIGAVPLRSPDTGKQIGDFVVTPRFVSRDRFEDYIEILNLLDSDISPETTHSLPLASGRNFRPPMYLEAIKFIVALEDLVKKSWRKFDRIEIVSREPNGQINWNKYIDKESNPENKLTFPVGRNVLSEFHTEYSQIRYVFDICKAELLSVNTPHRIKLSVRQRLDFLEEKLYGHLASKTDTIQLRFSDSQSVKNCKIAANRILAHNFFESTAWRVDYADVFEKFVQFLLKDIAKESGSRVMANYKFHGRAEKVYYWELKHLEPDVIFQKDERIVFIDAKYKSHLYNKFDDSEVLKEEHRRDVHQLLSYASFSNSLIKVASLCYPSDEIEKTEVQYRNPMTQAVNKVKIFGFPIKKSSMRETKLLLAKELLS